jgi:class 3 adenylate cyclase
VLELCLHATRAGLLRLGWDLLCPLCRGPAETGSSLSEVGSSVHCDSCNIDANVAFDRSVELTFRPSESIRAVEEVTFCLGGPALTRHVVTQQLLAPGTSRTLTPTLEEGRYRVRARDLPGSRAVRVAQGGGPDETVAVVEAGWPEDELLLAPASTLRLENTTGTERLLVLERTAWSDQAATAAEVTALQVFRDLFASEALRPGEPIDVGTLTIAFTDLRDSTRFYREVGDAPAFGSVLAHLDRLRGAVADEDGALVKTMGDAIMAVFRRPAGAVRALLGAQAALADEAPGFRLKAGIHTGPCIAVNQNGRLDYFGTTVNLAARLVSLSTGDDLVVSAAVLRDPEVAELLAGGLAAAPLEADLKGFEGEQLELWRVTRSG